MIKCKFEDRFQIDEGQLVRVVSAIHEKKNIDFDVYREYENGKNEVRNLYTSCYCGRVVAVPGERFSRYDNSRCTVEPWCECETIFIGCNVLTSIDYEWIKQLHPDFVNYVLPKWNKAKMFPLLRAEVLEALKIWKEYPKIELILALGFENIAFNKTFYKYTEAKQKQIIKFIFDHKDSKDCKLYTLNQINQIIKNKIPLDEYEDYLSFKRRSNNNKASFEVYKYLKKKGIDNYNGYELYKDYKALLKESDHNPKDEYWKYPADLQKAHDKVLAEVTTKRTLQEQQMLEERQKVYFEKVKRLSKYAAVVDGFEVYVPMDLAEWQTQATVLHQCIVWAEYWKKITNTYCLVFIKKDGVPVATAEIKGKEKTIGQFYGNEIDRNNCKPSEEVQAVLNKWLKTFSFSKQKKIA